MADRGGVQQAVGDRVDARRCVTARPGATSLYRVTAIAASAVDAASVIICRARLTIQKPEIYLLHIVSEQA